MLIHLGISYVDSSEPSLESDSSLSLDAVTALETLSATAREAYLEQNCLQTAFW